MRYLKYAGQHPYLLAALIVVLFLPWVWMAVLVPFWALALSLALVPVAAIVALALVIRDVNAEEEHIGTGGDEPFLKWRKRTRLFQQVVVASTPCSCAGIRRRRPARDGSRCSRAASRK